MHKAICLLMISMLCGVLSFGQTNQKQGTHTTDNFSKLENKILDTVMNLSEVKARAKYIKTKTNGKRNLQYTVWEKPTKEKPYYWVRVMEDNGSAYHAHFDFFVYPKNFLIEYYDIVNDTAITLSEWRKNYKN